MTEKPGILVDYDFWDFIENGHIRCDDLEDGLIQPASFDLTLGSIAYPLKASYRPKDSRVEKMIEHLSNNYDTINLEGNGAVLHPNVTYVVKLNQSLHLPDNIGGVCNPKSSCGRVDIMARVMANNCIRFDEIPMGYKGPLFIEITPLSFPIRLKKGISLIQMRLFRHHPNPLSPDELISFNSTKPILTSYNNEPVKDKISNLHGAVMGINLKPLNGSNIIGYKAKSHCGLVLDMTKINHLDIDDFFEPISAPKDGYLLLQKDHFYILASSEKVYVPPELSCEMEGFEAAYGEHRTHYAGFFDPGFSSFAVLEVRPRDINMMLRHGDPFFQMNFFKNTQTPKRTYGKELKSNYQGQRLRMAKYFKDYKGDIDCSDNPASSNK